MHAKFKDPRPSDSGEEDFLNIYAIYSPGGHLGHEPRGYKTFFKLSSAEHENSTAHKC